jgi:glycerophosphoryl diester phosphodiesterase
MLQIIGHRGAAGLAPENTIPSFEKAIALGVRRVECDVHVTADGHLIVIHDETVDRTTNGTGRVSELTLSTLRKLDAGNGAQIPTLGEVLQCAADGGVGIHIELKAKGAEEHILEVIAPYRTKLDIVIMSFDTDTLRLVRHQDLAVRLEHLFSEMGSDAFERALSIGASGVNVYYQSLNNDLVEEAHSLGLRVTAWTVNRIEDLRSLAAMGVDFVTTDRPDLMVPALRTISGD